MTRGVTGDARRCGTTPQNGRRKTLGIGQAGAGPARFRKISLFSSHFGSRSPWAGEFLEGVIM